ncbi:hypothetical protein D9M68_188470 [compost metagenome]
MADTVLDLSYLSDFVKRQTDGVDRTILLPNGKEMGLKLKIVGPDSDRAERAINEVQKEFAAKASASGDMSESSMSTERERRFAYAAKCCVSMTPATIKIGDEEFKATEDGLRMLFARLHFIGDQAYNQAISRSDFIDG